MKKKKLLITGSGGLIGSEAVRFFSKKGFSVCGIDNDMRSYFFGSEASTAFNVRRLQRDVRDYKHYAIDIRNINAVTNIFKNNKFSLIIHTAAQPSHDWASRAPLIDFSVNADATLYLLENFRKYCPEAVFIFTSTNKVYGDSPNCLPLREYPKRFDLSRGHRLYNGINETMSIDRSLHSLFGVSKLAADILVQEYGRYFGLKTVCFRAGCLTGSTHASTEMHGFLAYLGKCVAIGHMYKVFGYKGKQVRDNIHAFDLVNAMYCFFLSPKCGEVYNIGGGRFSNVSVLEAIEKFEKALRKKAVWKYVNKPRIGDHIWYISNVNKFKTDFPHWDYSYNIDDIIENISKFNR
ncbi:MAG: NAD-dependent epimerase [Candidatus Omnitrophica bacterium CG1_02_44_16]|nr:MAG: NAD-dependent epimerase [Candidatus Omnitrophica bacterium CG1_02_44_16]PIY83043.1 MAG: NAD-dependent epimerase [Candidatus Omnitrophica bacterium CG_4_10_14_0_8_um_filter_44_12]PIZ83370.1 MAG: NAD-dependent epimerase [Candidatus Omnitrophica bacterium CG_4_10_14_0_2_um_filter_44_9]